ncbi:uncharacterized protein LOC143085396 isoform X2 [Mytilus galloprovincialis]|uniref:uncharacterized protein LOC143085396 isoform X2 n=1 Tax=Mytilus galloprovincialis TaxID=29158 RepID=UPI003F7BBF5C
MDIAGEMSTARTPISKIFENDNRSLIKRPQTASPYVMAVKYRNKAKVASRKTNRAIITRRRTGRRKASLIDSEYGGCESSFHTYNTSLTDLFDEFNDDFDFDDLATGTNSVELESSSKVDTKQSFRDYEESFVTTSLESCSPSPVLAFRTSSVAGVKQEESESRSDKDPASYCENQYRRMCKMLNISPVSSFIRELSKKRVSVRHRSLCPKDAKAMSVALLENPTVQILDMTDNEIGPKGALYLAEMLTDNRIITDLNLSDNQIGIEGAKHIVNIAVEVDNFTSLNLSGNGFREFDAIHLTKLFEDTHNLLRLTLSHNEFREFGGKVIGDALKINDTLEELDLSWNHLRFDGADAIADGLALNQGLKKLDISWNGFSMRGCESLAKALEFNEYLIELNLECNRINKDALEKLLKGMKTNQSLEVLKLGWNPITTKGAQMILDFINDNPTSGLKKVDIRTQLVEKEFSENVKKLKEDKDILFIHGPIRGDHGSGEDDDELSLIDENPIIVLMEFGHMNGFRLTDLFSVFDKDGSKSLDLSEIKTGLMMAGIPLQEHCLELLIDKLDDDDSGEIEYAEMMQAQMIHRRQKAQMMKDIADGSVDIEKTEVGRVRGKLHKLMAKHMDGNPAFKRRVDDFKKLLESSQKDEILRKDFEKKVAMRKSSKVERERKQEITKATEEALQDIIEADTIESQMHVDTNKLSNLTLEKVDKDHTSLNNGTNKTPRSNKNENDWIALHV